MKKMLFLFVFLPFGLMAQNELNPTEINIFKNGTYFIIRDGNVNISAGKAAIKVPPSPLLSTFWLTTTKDVKIERILFADDTLQSNRSASSMWELLKINTGKKIKLVYSYDEKNIREISGTLMAFNPISYMIKIKTADNKITFLSSSSIKELIFEETPNEINKTDSIVRKGHITFNKASGSVPLRLSYMQSGIQWTPLYNIKILNDKELQLELKATVENYMETDLTGVDLVLTVGSPNFYYGAQLDPIANSFMSSLGLISSMNGVAGGTFATQRFDNYQVMAEESSADGDVNYNQYYNYNSDGEKSNDLYYYKLGKVDLPYNTKTTLMVFSQNVPYEDIYEVSITDAVNYQGYHYVQQTDNVRFDVFHSLKLTNSSTQPFTTGPVFVLDENLMPLAQDQLKYTAIKGQVSVQLARSPDVVVKYSEEETDRTDNYTTINRTRYTKVTVKGEINIENLQEKEIVLNVDKVIYANVVSVSDGGKFKKIGVYYGVNPASQVKWEIPLKAGEKKTLTYTYEVLIAV